MTQIDMQLAQAERKSEIMPYQFDGLNVRVVRQGDDVWFVGADVCRSVGLSSHKGSYSHHFDKLDTDEKRLIDRKFVIEATTPTFNMGVGARDFLSDGGKNTFVSGDDPLTLEKATSIWLVSESGLYSIILRSRDAMSEGSASHRFRKWVTSIVLPQIRKTGGYSASSSSVTIGDLLANPQQLLAITQGYALQIEDMRREIGSMQVEVATLDRIAGTDEIFGVRVTAKLLQMEEKKFTAWIQRLGWAYRQPGTKSLLCYAEKQKAGFVLNKAAPFTKPSGEEGLRETLKFTPKGIVRLAKMLNITLTEGDMFAKSEG